MTTLHRGALLAIGLLLVASPGWSVANVTFSRTLSSVDPTCDQLFYAYGGTADFTTNDDGSGNDWIAFVYSDGTGNYHDVDFGFVTGPGDPILGFDDLLGSLPFAGFFGSRGMFVRVHDIPNPGSTFENTKEGLELASAAPVAFELYFDPANDAVECTSKPINDAVLRIESLKNPGGAFLTTSPALLDLSGTGAYSLTIAVPGWSMLAAMYRAECVNAGSNGDVDWVDVDLQVDGVGLPPSGGNPFDAFCTSNGVAGNDEWVMARTSGAQLVPGPAVHRVEVFARTNGSTGNLEDQELVVMVPEPPGGQLRAAGVAALALLAWRRRRHTAERAPRARRSRRLAGHTALGVIAAFAAVPIRAATVLEGTRNNSNQTFLASGGPTLLDLGGGTSFALNLARSTRVVIQFTAECTVDTANVFTWLDLDIRVDGVAVPESDDTDDAFCSSTGATPGTTDDWVSNAIHVTIDLAPGVHGIEVLGKLQGLPTSADVWWIGDLNLTVTGQEF